jgi:hypothetical protein
MAQTLKLGSKGPDVTKLQQLLNQKLKPSPNLVPDGNFGPKTDAAVRAFQKAKGLTPDGVVGPKTWSALEGTPTPGGGNNSGGGNSSGGTTAPPEANMNANWPPKPNFSPLVSTTQRQAVFGKFDYVADPKPDNPENIKVLGDWASKNIVTVELPQLSKATGGHYKKMRFHRLGAEQLKRMWAEWESAGLLDRVLTYAGSYVPRFIRGSTTVLSNHAFGTAFDINVAWNGLNKVPALVGQKGCVRELVPIAHKHGFYWGGHFSRQDGMHFEVAVVQP